MKLLTILLVSLLSVSLISAHQCGVHQCDELNTCVLDGTYSCHYHCNEIMIEQSIVSKWSDDNNTEPNLQVEVKIINVGHRHIRDVIIGTIRIDEQRIWGVTIDQGKNIHLPSYVTLAPGESHSFGYLKRGHFAATLFVKAVTLN
ncbi:hypothetical protein CYY_007424 [Polysphondylium violaceum]|uniref:Carbohydrate binding domain-containing protein n=1 Tax=Polysphondylium violaceum TaxID=133409 RepID=A0A8J4UQW5_9MYCE|nr:hypothetical protein CYY_007424 [Polysphondylium violaceum]